MKGQSWSMDLVVAVVVFGFMAVIAASLFIMQEKPSIEDLQGRAQFIESRLEQNVGTCGTIIQNQTLTTDKLRCLFSQDYDTLKEQLGVDGEFCIYIEDAQGNLYIVRDNANNELTGFGHENLILSDTPCGQPR